MAPVRLRIVVQGMVQGVGFRPFVHRLASRLSLCGSVRNSDRGVTLEVEGPRAAVERFRDALRREGPPLCRIEQLESEELPPRGAQGFSVLASTAGGESRSILIPPDVATCPRCLAELADPGDRRHRYPFINCTDCGPRFTIIDGLPYDRPLTAMREFPLCPECRAEYEAMTDRRYHAQPVACPACGPRPWLVDASGRPVDADDPVSGAVRLLEAGRIGAIKGLGGFHLACDAGAAAAVRRLRETKRRPHKPFAVMARDLDAVGRFARATDAERELLTGWRRPIVLLAALPSGDSPLAAEVSGTSEWVGTMLPYTPLHQLLLDGGRYAALVMTSGNRRDEPIVVDNDAALAGLHSIADFFLLHDRPILNRADDSVVAVMDAATPTLSPVRRSRGYVPEPVRLPRPGRDPVLAVGGDLKNTCGLTRGSQAILSQHIGDLEHPAAAEMLETGAPRLAELFGVEPELVVHDLHPDYHSTRFAEELGLPRLAVQHHHAHALACLAESGLDGPALAVVLDGTGLGTDGAIWGGELLRVDGLAFERLSHLRYLPLPGGDQAARYPFRMALAALTAAFGPDLPATARRLPPFSAADPARVEAVLGLCLHEDTPLTSSTGRLFDAVASLLDLRHEISFEGQGAMELERLARGSGEHEEVLPWRLDGDIIDLLPAVRALSESAAPRPHLARALHNTLAAALVEAAARAAHRTGLRTVALSGGALQNRILHRRLVDGLAARGLAVLFHRRVPPNDGGLALGQLWAGVLAGHR